MVWNDNCGKIPQLLGLFHTFSTVVKLGLIFILLIYNVLYKF